MQYLTVVTQPVPESILDGLRRLCDVRVNRTGRPMTHEELVGAVSEADAVMTVLTDRVDEAVMRSAGGRLKVVANIAVGYDNLDLESIYRHGAVATNTPPFQNSKPVGL